MNEPFKTCIKCGQSFPQTTEYFNRDSSKPDGFCPYCKKCRHAERAEQYKNSPSLMEKTRERAAKWFLDNIERARENRKKQYQNNREKAIADARKWREENIDKYKEYNREHHKCSYPNNKERINCNTRNRRAKIAGLSGKHTKKDIDNLFVKQSGKCFYCGDILNTYQVDHVIPVSRGGSNSPDNLVLACEFCNKSKGNRLPEEWNPIK